MAQEILVMTDYVCAQSLLSTKEGGESIKLQDYYDLMNRSCFPTEIKNSLMRKPDKKNDFKYLSVTDPG